MDKRKVIIDTDPGIDDAVALMTALSDPSLDILGFTTVAGNKGLDMTTTNAVRVATYFDRRVKIYPGANNDYMSLKEHKPARENATGDIHGSNGMGGVDFPYDESLIQETHAVDFILDSIKANPGEVDLIALGPLTNIAMAVEKDVETMKQLRSITTMGGAAYGGNVGPVAEFNYWFDPFAVDIVYQALGEIVPITMVGLDVTGQSLLDMNDLEFMRLAGGELGGMIREMFDAYILNAFKNEGTVGTVIHDLVAVVGYLHPDIFTEIHHANLVIETKGEYTYGQTVIDFDGATGRSKNVVVAMDIDLLTYKEYVMATLFGEEICDLYLDYLG
jgi:purine nucleosidase/pyrimidine-specific ribonucleoside hydrolase